MPKSALAVELFSLFPAAGLVEYAITTQLDGFALRFFSIDGDPGPAARDLGLNPLAARPIKRGPLSCIVGSSSKTVIQ